MISINKKMMVLPVFGVLVFCGSMGMLIVLKGMLIKEPPPPKIIQSEPTDTKAILKESQRTLAKLSSSSLLKPFSNSDMAKFLAEVEVLKQEYEKKKEMLTWKEKMLESIQSNIEAEKKELVALRNELTETIRLAGEKKTELEQALIVFEESESKNLKKLATVYGGMKPDKAAAIIKEMDDDTAVKLLSLMDGRNSARILQAIDPNRAVKLSEKIRVVSR